MFSNAIEIQVTAFQKKVRETLKGNESPKVVDRSESYGNPTGRPSNLQGSTFTAVTLYMETQVLFIPIEPISFYKSF